MLKLVPQSWQQVRHQWGWVQNGLQAIIERTHERWMPLDVWTALRSNNAFLHTIDKDGDDAGFVVLRQEIDPDGPALFIWCCWVEPGSLADCHAELITALDEVAARIGAKRIRFESTRDGWRGFDQYFDAVFTAYERER